MEQGALKIRVRSLENERALERMALTQASTSALLVASVLLQLGLSPAVGRVPSLLAYGGAALSAAKALGATAKTAAFDKKALKFETKDFMSRGADIAFLSVYPTEQEALYPPLTYLRCLEMKMETLSGVQLLVATVEPVMA